MSRSTSIASMEAAAAVGDGDDTTVTTQVPGEMSVSYRVTPQLGVQLVSTSNDEDNNNNNQEPQQQLEGGNNPAETAGHGPMSMNHVRPLEFAPEGLKSISLTNFTGRLVFHRVISSAFNPESDANSLFSESSVSHFGSVRALSELGESSTHNSGSARQLSISEAQVAAAEAAAAAALSSNTTTTQLPPPTPENSADEPESSPRPTSSSDNNKSNNDGLGTGLGFLTVATTLMNQNENSTATPTPTTSNVAPSYRPAPAPVPRMMMAASPRPTPTSAGGAPPPVSTVSTSMEVANDKNNSSTTKKLSGVNLLRKVLKATTKTLRYIPDSIRSKRHERKSSHNNTTTPLHILCAQPHGVRVEALLECLKRHPNAIRTKDAMGRFPLHVLGDNETLITTTTTTEDNKTTVGRDVATVLATHLMNEFPNAILVPDKEGFVPFARIVADWVDWAQEQELRKKKRQQPQQQRGSSSDPTMPRTNGLMPDDNLEFYPCREGGLFHSSHVGGSFQKMVFPRVEIWEEAEWCLTLLSTALDILSRNSNLPMFQRLKMGREIPQERARFGLNITTSSSQGSSVHHHADVGSSTASTRHLASNDRKMLVEALLAKMPMLVKIILLIDDDGMDTRERVLEMAICRRLLLCPQTVGKWLIEMFNHGGTPAKRAVDFLCLISKTSVEDHTGGYGTIHSGDLDAFNKDRQDVFEAVGALKGTIASLVSLENRETDRAAATAVIWHTMSQKLSRPFVLGLVLIDLLLHLTLMVSFRDIVNPNSELSGMGVLPEGLVAVISLHYLLRKGCEAWVLLTVSPSALKAYFTNMWTVFDSIAIIFTLWATIWDQNIGEDEYKTGLNALVIGLLWLKVLGFLKVVNKEMSTFIMALSQILYDIRFFMVVLIVCVFMFGDMFYIAVSSKDNTQFCTDDEQESGAIEDFCDSGWTSYLRVYSILLGDFELDDMTATPGTTVLFIIFTVFGVVILLNVLIAVISDSYEKATMSGNLLFGRARVLYVAQNEALEHFLQPSRRTEAAAAASAHSGAPAGAPNRSSQHKHRRIRVAIRWCVLTVVLLTAVYALLYLIGLAIVFAENSGWVGFAFAVCMGAVLACALWVVGTFILDGLLRDLLPDRAENVYDAIGRINNILVGGISNWLFGLTKQKVATLSSDEATDEDWTGRVNYLETVMERMITETRAELKAEIKEMRAEMNEHFEDDS